mmetsp:Transcript_41975/g.122844  ORF Transcript_41975/g.122844 Transcript_41975/m.122844 type:complete len:771 (+) Transcript_41975:691-3003(+)
MRRHEAAEGAPCSRGQDSSGGMCDGSRKGRTTSAWDRVATSCAGGGRARRRLLLFGHAQTRAIGGRGKRTLQVDVLWLLYFALCSEGERADGIGEQHHRIADRLRSGRRRGRVRRGRAKRRALLGAPVEVRAAHELGLRRVARKVLGRAEVVRLDHQARRGEAARPPLVRLRSRRWRALGLALGTRARAAHGGAARLARRRLELRGRLALAESHLLVARRRGWRRVRVDVLAVLALERQRHVVLVVGRVVHAAAERRDLDAARSAQRRGGNGGGGGTVGRGLGRCGELVGGGWGRRGACARREPAVDMQLERTPRGCALVGALQRRGDGGRDGGGADEVDKEEAHVLGRAAARALGRERVVHARQQLGAAHECVEVELAVGSEHRAEALEQRMPHKVLPAAARGVALEEEGDEGLHDAEQRQLRPQRRRRERDVRDEQVGEAQLQQRARAAELLAQQWHRGQQPRGEGDGTGAFGGGIDEHPERQARQLLLPQRLAALLHLQAGREELEGRRGVCAVDCRLLAAAGGADGEGEQRGEEGQHDADDAVGAFERVGLRRHVLAQRAQQPAHVVRRVVGPQQLSHGGCKERAAAAHDSTQRHDGLVVDARARHARQPEEELEEHRHRVRVQVAQQPAHDAVLAEQVSRRGTVREQDAASAPAPVLQLDGVETRGLLDEPPELSEKRRVREHRLHRRLRRQQHGRREHKLLAPPSADRLVLPLIDEARQLPNEELHRLRLREDGLCALVGLKLAAQRVNLRLKVIRACKEAILL